jgi:phage antirepressor YoqD-like protein
LLTGYDVKARLTVIKRWKELESKQPSFVIPTTLSGALLLAAKQAEQIEQQQLLIEQQKPAVDFVEGYVESRGTLSLRDAGKTLGWGQKAFIAMLMDDFLYRNKQGTLLPYAKFIKEEYFVVKTGSEHDHQFIQTRVTPKGMTFLANYLDTV